MRKLNDVSFLTAILLSAVLIFVALYFHYPSNIISWDVFGYYLYLPQTFIYNDPGIHDVTPVNHAMEIYHGSPYFYQAHLHENGNHIPQYPIGMAIIFLPFFLLGHLFAFMGGYPMDGYSLPYETAMLIGCASYIVAGVFLFRRLLLHFFDTKITTIVLILVGFGSNYYYMNTVCYGMPHIYLFTWFCAFILLTISWHKKPGTYNSLGLGAILGLMSVCRPTEFLIVLIPLFWNVKSFSDLKIKIRSFFTSHRKYVFLVVLGSLVLVVPQLIYWKKFAGEFIYYSYKNPGEGFEFLTPYTLDFLFSFRKGWLIYTPVMIFALCGIIVIRKYKPEIFLSILVFTVLNIYVLSSWSNWWYAGSFGQRPMIQSYPLMGIALGFFIYWLSKQTTLMRIPVYLLMFLFLFLNLFQSWQTNNGIIDISRMTKEYYFAVFGKTKVPEGAEKLLLINRKFAGEEKFTDSTGYKKTLQFFYGYEKPGELNEKLVVDTFGFQSTRCVYVSDKNAFSQRITIPYNQMTGSDHAWIRVNLDYYFEGNIQEVKPSVIVSFLNKRAQDYKYTGHDIDALPEAKPGQWNHLQFDFLSPEVRNVKDKFSLYLWLRGKGYFYVDNIKIEVFAKPE